MYIDIFNTEKRYDVIYADPPWSYKVWNGKGKDKKTAENHYKCMKREEVQKLPIPQMAADDCVLFLWVTFPCLEEGLDLIKAWGFTYKTCAFNWVKRNKKSDSWFWGLGHWTRANSEICLLATKGKPKRISRSVHQVCDARVMEHSKKPPEIRDRIVELMGEETSKIELFARSTHPNFDCWGDETNLNI